MTAQTMQREEFKVQTTKVIEKIKNLVHAGNIRRLIVKNKEGKALLDLPLTVGVIGAILAPQLAVLGAIAALLIDGSLVIEKMEDIAEEREEASLEGMFEI